MIQVLLARVEKCYGTLAKCFKRFLSPSSFRKIVTICIM